MKRSLEDLKTYFKKFGYQISLSLRCCKGWLSIQDFEVPNTILKDIKRIEKRTGKRLYLYEVRQNKDNMPFRYILLAKTETAKNRIRNAILKNERHKMFMYQNFVYFLTEKLPKTSFEDVDIVEI